MSTPFVARIDLHPIKGFDAVPVESATVLPSGALAGDRRWAFVDRQDRFVNGKQFPAIHRIRARIDPDASAAVFDDLHFRLTDRFRTNIEIGGVPAFWEDSFYGGTCRVGVAAAPATADGVAFVLVNPCARCAVPSRDALTGEPIIGFQKRFAEQRRATLAPGVDLSPFDHYYRLAVNTRLAPGSIGGAIRVGDPLHVSATALTASGEPVSS